MIKKTSISFLFTCLLFVGLKAQTVQPPIETYLNLELVSKVTVPDSLVNTFFNPMDLVSPTDTLLVSATIILPDTNAVDKIHIKLGSTLGGNDLLDQQFTYDVPLQLPQMYERNQDMIRICFGEYLNSNIFYCEIILEDNLGNLSTITKCQSDQ